MTAFGEYADDNSASAIKARDHKDATDLIVASGVDTVYKRRGGFGWSQLNGISPTLESEAGKHQGGPERLPLVHAIAPTLSTKNEVASSSTQRDAWYEQSAAMLGAVRRLTPLECERLQGFPDGWTAEGIDGPQSDSARYRQLGNAVAVPVARWLAERIKAVSE